MRLQICTDLQLFILESQMEAGLSALFNAAHSVTKKKISKCCVDSLWWPLTASYIHVLEPRRLLARLPFSSSRVKAFGGKRLFSACCEGGRALGMAFMPYVK